MYLKSVELIGFKSFTEKTRITLEQGISCIVGPNGSGKSNIADALRWVLGEQSAKSLRGGALSDVIFSGSKKRKSLGMAEVCITLDNGDGHLNVPFSEVSVGRRTFRSGQSEYLLNNQVCRLKDVQNLFLDSGIGLEGISIISQGEIHELIAAKPEERRVLIEEAAGIVKFRNRKRETIKKLDETERNLERLGDIIGELNLRLEPLSFEAAKARRYLELSGQADALEMTLSLQFLRDLQSKLSAFSPVLDALDEKILALETAKISAEAEAERLRLAVGSAGEEVAFLQKEFYELRGQGENLRGQREVLSAKAELAAANKDRLDKEMTELAARSQEKAEEAAGLKAEAARLKAEITGEERSLLDGEGGQESHRQSIAVFEDKLAALKDEAFEAANAVANIRNKLHYEEQMMDNGVQALRRLEEQENQLKAAAEEAGQKKAVCRERIIEAQKQREEAKAALGEKEREQMELTERIAALAAEETDARFRLHSLLSRVSMMEEMTAGYEGYYPGVRAVLLAKKEGRPEMQGVLDSLAALIDVPEAYRVAVETYLGAALQDVVCQRESDAKAAIAYLKAKGAGRATFLPLDTLRPRPLADPAETEGMDGVYGCLARLVQYPPHIEKAVQFRLGQVLLAENLEAAAKAAARLNYRCTVITLDGDMVNPGGSLSGGSKNKKSGEFLGRKAKLEAGKKQLRELESELAGWEGKLTQARGSLNALSAETDRLSALLQQVNSNAYAAQKDIEALEALDALGKKQLETVLLEKKQRTEEARGLEASIRELRLQRDEWQEKNAAVLSDIEALQRELSKKHALFDERREDVTRFRVELARKKELLSALLKDEERLLKERETLAWEQEEKHSDRLLLEGELASYESALSSQRTAESQITELLEQKERELESKRRGLSGEHLQLQEREKQARAAGAEIEELRREQYQHQIKKARHEADWENEEGRLKEKFNMDFAEAAAAESGAEKPDMNKKDLRELLQSLKREILQLGAVNVGAIEEHQEANKRYVFLTSQRHDLLEAEAALKKVILDVNTIMSVRFKAAFDRLNDEFELAFRRLFMGGAASLALTRPDDLLETGVDIVVQPPGKKINNYNLLSGGEKSLVGIALMFAVLAVRPTPFCVMDEVDAALDEANVQRFADYLRELSAKTQFLMISHRQSTMEAASSLWGVTMEEEGVSKVISVRLSDVAQVS